MTHLPDLAALIEVNDDATVSRTVLKAEGARIVLFSFDTGQELSEHTAAMLITSSGSGISQTQPWAKRSMVMLPACSPARRAAPCPRACGRRRR